MIPRRRHRRRVGRAKTKAPFRPPRCPSQGRYQFDDLAAPATPRGSKRWHALFWLCGPWPRASARTRHPEHFGVASQGAWRTDRKKNLAARAARQETSLPYITILPDGCLSLGKG